MIGVVIKRVFDQKNAAHFGACAARDRRRSATSSRAAICRLLDDDRSFAARFANDADFDLIFRIGGQTGELIVRIRRGDGFRHKCRRSDRRVGDVELLGVVDGVPMEENRVFRGVDRGKLRRGKLERINSTIRG